MGGGKMSKVGKFYNLSPKKKIISKGAVVGTSF